jgi:hypothetical protein
MASLSQLLHNQVKLLPHCQGLIFTFIVVAASVIAASHFKYMPNIIPFCFCFSLVSILDARHLDIGHANKLPQTSRLLHLSQVLLSCIRTITFKREK